MGLLEIILIVAAVLIVGNVMAMFAITWPIAKREYANMFIRETEDKWARENSCPENEEHSVMFDAGINWGKENANAIKEVCIENDGLKLYGEYFDFGGSKCAIILPGRAESLLYCYYFAEPYKKMGYNILVVDQRAHGKSEGVYNCVGVKERDDIKCWMEYIHNTFGDEKFFIHGVCIGSSIAIFLGAMNTPGLEGIALEGPYVSFLNVLTQRTKARKKPPFPIVQEMTYLFKKKAGINIVKEKPVNYIKKVNVPTLFLCGRKDYSSLPAHMDKLYKLCGAENKKMVWFDEGAHSHLRISNTEEYDKAIEDFIEKL